MATADQVLQCSFERWYNKFESVSFRSRIVQLPPDFVDYLVQDGVYLPEQNSAVSCDTACEQRSTHTLLTCCRDCLQLPERSAPDPTATDDEYREWSEDDSSSAAGYDEQVVSCTPSLFRVWHLRFMLQLSVQVPSWSIVAGSIREAIAILGGRVIPKLNWSCPKVCSQCCYFQHNDLVLQTAHLYITQEKTARDCLHPQQQLYEQNLC